MFQCIRDKFQCYFNTGTSLPQIIKFVIVKVQCWNNNAKKYPFITIKETHKKSRSINPFLDVSFKVINFGKRWRRFVALLLYLKFFKESRKILPSLTYSSPMFHFYTPWKRQKPFLTFPGGIKMERWAKKG